MSREILINIIKQRSFVRLFICHLIIFVQSSGESLSQLLVLFWQHPEVETSFRMIYQRFHFNFTYLSRIVAWPLGFRNLLLLCVLFESSFVYFKTSTLTCLPILCSFLNPFLCPPNLLLPVRCHLLVTSRPQPSLLCHLLFLQDLSLPLVCLLEVHHPESLW